MAGMICPVKGCGHSSNDARPPQCTMSTCPGRETFALYDFQRAQNLKKAFAENDIPWPVHPQKYRPLPQCTSGDQETVDRGESPECAPGRGIPTPLATCPKCSRTRHDWDCAEDGCPMAAPTSHGPVAEERGNG